MTHPTPTAGGGHTAGDWLPIESAPKDGSSLIAWAPGFGMGALTLFWSDGYWREPAQHLGLKVEPTHWMPLPPPPAAQAKASQATEADRG